MDSPSSKENEQNEKFILYVGNLSLKTLDSDIYRLFQTVGTLRSVKVVRPTNTQFYFKPTCYAYVSYVKPEDAEEAIKRLNFYEMHGMQMRVMYCDKSSFKFDAGNVVVKNLPDYVDDKTLYDTFSIFGKILSAKVSVVNGKSMGYGYVQYEDKKSAKKAIKYGTGTQIKPNILTVEKYEKKSNNTENVFTNVYVKNFPRNIEEECLKSILSKFGEISSFHMPKKENGEAVGFAFCNFVSVDSAKKAILELNNTNLFDLPEPFYVQRAQVRSEREIEIRSHLAKLSIEGRTNKRNLYVTNIPENCGEEEVAAVFKQYGSIISVVVEKDTKSKVPSNYAYVCFACPEEAKAVVERSNEITLEGNKLLISFFKAKRERELERESNNLFYNPGLAHANRMSYFYDRRTENDSKIYNDLYKCINTIAYNYEESFPLLNVSSRSEFADKMANKFLKRPRGEIRNMIELTSVLMESLNEMVREYDKDDDVHLS